MLKMKWISIILISTVIHISIYLFLNYNNQCDKKTNTDRHVTETTSMCDWHIKTNNPTVVEHESKRLLDEIGKKEINLTSEPYKKDKLYEIFNNNKSPMELVPNIVHYIWLDMYNNLTFRFLNAVSYTSVQKFWKPDQILVHVFEKHYPRGIWWKFVQRNVSGIQMVEHNMSELTIYGNKPKFVEHMTDFLRIRVIQEHGGIYIDNDVLALRSIEPLRHYEHTQGIGKRNDGLSGGVIIARKGSPLLKLWIEAYKTYGNFRKTEHTNYSLWAYYSIGVPRTLVNLYPHLIHIEVETLVRPQVRFYMDKSRIKSVWENNYSIHVWHRSMTVPDSPEEIQNLSTGSLLRQAMEYIWFNKKPLDMS